jgi:hypothetical protein
MPRPVRDLIEFVRIAHLLKQIGVRAVEDWRRRMTPDSLTPSPNPPVPEPPIPTPAPSVAFSIAAFQKWSSVIGFLVGSIYYFSIHDTSTGWTMLMAALGMSGFTTGLSALHQNQNAMLGDLQNIRNNPAMPGTPDVPPTNPYLPQSYYSGR